MYLHDIRDLDDWVLVRSWELPFGGTALNIKGQNTKWRNFRLNFERYRLNIIEVNDIEFKLAS